MRKVCGEFDSIYAGDYEEPSPVSDVLVKLASELASAKGEIRVLSSIIDNQQEVIDSGLDKIQPYEHDKFSREKAIMAKDETDAANRKIMKLKEEINGLRKELEESSEKASSVFAKLQRERRKRMKRNKIIARAFGFKKEG